MELSNFESMDPIMLYSIINLKLRDFYSSLEALCADNSINEKDLKVVLGKVGFEYNESLNQFR